MRTNQAGLKKEQVSVYIQFLEVIYKYREIKELNLEIMRELI